MPVTERFLIHRWADGCAVFDQTSGDTHTLDVASGAGFFATLNGESAMAAVGSALRSQWPEKKDEEITFLVQECLQRLEACGLIQSGSCID